MTGSLADLINDDKNWSKGAMPPPWRGPVSGPMKMQNMNAVKLADTESRVGGLELLIQQINRAIQARRP